MKIVAFEDDEADWLVAFLHIFLEQFEDEGPNRRSSSIAKSIIFKLSI